MALTKSTHRMIEGGVVNVLDYGAVGDGTTDDTLKIQAAIDAAAANGGGIVFLPKRTYKVFSRDYINSAGATVGRCCLIMKDGVHLKGEGWGSIIKLADNQYIAGTYFRLIASDTINLLVQATISDLTIDGSRSANPTHTDGSNVILEGGRDITIQNVNSISSMGNGIMIRGTTSSFMTNIKVLDCKVTDHSMIGIQCAQFNGLVISNNYVSGTDNNCIDIYGNDGNVSNPPHGKNFTVSDNVCLASPSNAGIFPETVSDGVISGNSISGCNDGIHCNTIDNKPENINICENTIVDCATGIWVSGATEGVRISDNFISDFTANGVKLGSATKVEVTRNYFRPPNATTYLILHEGTNNAYNRVFDNTVNLTGFNSSYYVNDTATSTSDNFFGGINSQLGYVDTGDVVTQLLRLDTFRGSGTGPFDITIPDNTGGRVMVTLYNSGTSATEMKVFPYVKRGGTLSIGTATDTASITATTITSATSVSNNMRITPVTASNNFIEAGIEMVKVT